MASWRHEERVETGGNGSVIDLTEAAVKAVSESGITEGILVVYTAHTTAAVTTIECEPGCRRDIGEVLERLVPRDAPYHHAHANPNAHSHMQATLIGPSVSIPIAGGRPILGTWQYVVLVDFDVDPRSRTVVYQIVGEQAGG